MFNNVWNMYTKHHSFYHWINIIIITINASQQYCHIGYITDDTKLDALFCNEDWRLKPQKYKCVM